MYMYVCVCVCVCVCMYMCICMCMCMYIYTCVCIYRIHGIRSLAYFGPWTGKGVVGNEAAQGKVYVW